MTGLIKILMIFKNLIKNSLSNSQLWLQVKLILIKSKNGIKLVKKLIFHIIIKFVQGCMRFRIYP